MPDQYLAAHETMEIHEMLNIATNCLAKSKMMTGAVNDVDLRNLLEKDVRQSMKAVEELTSIYARALIQ